MTTNNLVAKIWSFCDTLRDDGVSYSDYLEQLTYLLFLKMAHEYEKGPKKRKSDIPVEYNWKSLSTLSGEALHSHYIKVLNKLGTQKGMLGHIFNKAQNKIQDPTKLDKLVKLIDGENWVIMDADVKGDIYEGLLEKNAEDTKSGAGQYFTPRHLIKAIVECIQPELNTTIADPSCGTGGFFLEVLEFYKTHHGISIEDNDFVRNDSFIGWEIVPSTARLCLMNLFLHGIGDLKSTPKIYVHDSLKEEVAEKVDYVLANPPFGKTSSDITTNDVSKKNKEGYIYRPNFWTTTANKQLAFLQHIVGMLKDTGKAAVVLPDNILFEGGAGETIRKELLKRTELHTILRLPTGIFYAHGVKANVLFFDARPIGKSPATKEVWFYDYRTNVNHTLKKNPLKYDHLKDFIECYNTSNRRKRKETWSEANPDGRWRKFTYNEIIERDKTNLDIFWLKDDSTIDLDNLPEPENILNEIIENLRAGLASFEEVADILKENEK